MGRREGGEVVSRHQKTCFLSKLQASFWESEQNHALSMCTELEKKRKDSPLLLHTHSEVVQGGAGGAAAPPIFWRGKGNSDVIIAMTSSLLKDSPMNVW